MSDRLWDDVADDAGDRYEEHLVPVVFDRWWPRMLAAGSVGRRDRVLDVACGTGIVARNALQVVGDDGYVAGLDRTPAMLRTAARIEPGVDWRLGDAADLPFDDESFDVVLSQAGLMFFSDKAKAVREMRRVLRPGGRLAILVWGRSERHDSVMAALLDAGFDDVAERYRGPWSFPDPEALRELVTGAGFADVSVSVEEDGARYESFDEFIAGSSAILLHGAAEPNAVMAAVERGMAPFRNGDGSYDAPGTANIATATRR